MSVIKLVFYIHIVIPFGYTSRTLVHSKFFFTTLSKKKNYDQLITIIPLNPTFTSVDFV